jgi:hypothetical protein
MPRNTVRSLLALLLACVAFAGVGCGGKTISSPDSEAPVSGVAEHVIADSARALDTLDVTTPHASGSTATQTATASAITWRYSGPYYMSVNPLTEAYADNMGIDFDAYGKLKYGPSASAYLIANNAYSWRIKYWNGSRWNVTGIDVGDAARVLFNRRYPRNYLKNWGIYLLNYNNPYSWRAAYIFKL